MMSLVFHAFASRSLSPGSRTSPARTRRLSLCVQSRRVCDVQQIVEAVWWCLALGACFRLFGVQSNWLVASDDRSTFPPARLQRVWYDIHCIYVSPCSTTKGLRSRRSWPVCGATSAMCTRRTRSRSRVPPTVRSSLTTTASCPPPPRSSCYGPSWWATNARSPSRPMATDAECDARQRM